MAAHLKNSPRRRPLAAALCVFLVVGLAAGLYWFQPWRLWTNTVVDDALPALAADVSRQVASGPAATEFMTAPTMSTSVASVPPPTISPSTTADRIPPPVAAPSSAGRAIRSTAVPPPPRQTSEVTVLTSAVAPTPAAASKAITATATVLATGTLITHEHRTSGTVRIVRLADRSRVLTLENLRTSDGPALHVWLTDAPVVDGEDGWKVFDDGRYADLGNLKGNVGNQVYPLRADLDLTPYTSVSIWCKRFSVSFGAAELIE